MVGDAAPVKGIHGRSKDGILCGRYSNIAEDFVLKLWSLDNVCYWGSYPTSQTQQAYNQNTVSTEYRISTQYKQMNIVKTVV